jgi:hypothetical protein
MDALMQRSGVAPHYIRFAATRRCIVNYSNKVILVIVFIMEAIPHEKGAPKSILPISGFSAILAGNAEIYRGFKQYT